MNDNRFYEVKKYYGSTPAFRDEIKFLPLQSADFYAWWVRKWYVDGMPEKIREFDFGTFTRKRGEKEHLVVEISFNEDQLTANFIQMLRAQIGPGYSIYDVKIL